MSTKLSLGFSTCPNDTFMFDAIIHGKIKSAFQDFDLILEDIRDLNQLALERKPDIVKVSYNAFGHLMDDYTLLPSGSAMGRGCGPLLITREPESAAALLEREPVVAIPGKNTTANLLLHYFAPGISKRLEVRFDEVMPAVASGQADAGVIIHENRFTYQEAGLHCVQDLGAYWEAQTGLPIPLGAIVARSSLGPEAISALGEGLRKSIAFAFEHPEASAGFVREHAQELSDTVTRQHIDLYVNEYSLDMGTEGQKAILKLMETGEEMGLYPAGTADRFEARYLQGTVSQGLAPEAG